MNLSTLNYVFLLSIALQFAAAVVLANYGFKVSLEKILNNIQGGALIKHADGTTNITKDLLKQEIKSGYLNMFSLYTISIGFILMIFGRQPECTEIKDYLVVSLIVLLLAVIIIAILFSLSSFIASRKIERITFPITEKSLSKFDIEPDLDLAEEIDNLNKE